MEATKPLCIVQLGRYGDICNILPLCELMHARGRTPKLVVADRFFDLVRGLTYCTPHEWQGDTKEPGIARDYFEGQGYEVWCTQVSGNDRLPGQWSDNFTAEQWERAGHLGDFHRMGFSLPYDDAEAQRWFDRLTGVIPPNKPVLAVNFAAHSAPLAPDEVAAYRGKLQLLAPDVHVLDLSDVRLPDLRLLVGILKRCRLLLTLDTATLHLAYAAKCPTIALVPERHWHTPEPRDHWIGRFGYAEALTPDGWRKVEALIRAPLPDTYIGRLVRVHPDDLLARKIVHVASTFEARGEDARRNAMAMATWKPNHHERFAEFVEHRAGERGAPDRTSAAIGDPRGVPYLKDVIDHAAARCDTGRDIIMLTNADTCLVPETWSMVRRAMHQAETCCSARADFRRIDLPIPWQAVAMPAPYCGTDLFAFTRRWWDRMRGAVPDVLLACEGWDAMLRWLIKAENPDGELRPVVCYHEWHNPFWAAHRFDNPGQQHNRRELTAWCKSNGYADRLSDAQEWLFKRDDQK